MKPKLLSYNLLLSGVLLGVPAEDLARAAFLESVLSEAGTLPDSIGEPGTTMGMHGPEDPDPIST